MLVTLLSRLTGAIRHRLQTGRARVLAWTKPATSGQALGTLADLARSRPELVAENALLRQQLSVLRRSVKRPKLTRVDRVLLLLLAGRVRAWQQALLIVKPDTLLRWHRQGFRLFWRHKSKVTTRTPRVPAETVALIAEMARNNRLGAPSGSAASSANSASACPSARSRSTCGVPVRRDHAGRRGRPSCATTHPRSGRAISQR